MKKYEKPEIEISQFEVENIINTSGGLVATKFSINTTSLDETSINSIDL